MTKKDTANKIVKKWRNVITVTKGENSTLDSSQAHNMLKDFADIDSSTINKITLRYAIAWRRLDSLTVGQAELLLRDITNFIYN